MSDLPPNDSTRSYSTADVAKRLGVSIPTVQRWVDSGRLKAWKTLGGHRRIEAQSAERLFAEQAAPGAQGTAGVDTLPVTVTIVDDNPDDRDILALLVHTALPGARISSFASGFEALVAIGHTAPDIVITDIVMPDMNGIEMLRQLSSRCVVRPRLIVAVSSLTPAQLASLGELPPEVGFVAKPIDPRRFVDTLRAAW